MNQEMKIKWLEALRSGKYKQAVSRLMLKDHRGQRYCCLGVLCEISGLGEWTEEPSYSNVHEFIYNRGHFASNLPPAMREALGISDDDIETLVNMNDLTKASFTQIADWIERNL